MFHRPRPTRTKPPAAAPAPLPQGLLDEFADREYGIVGECAVVRPAQPPAPPAEPLRLEAPPWADDPLAHIAPPAETTPLVPGAALAAIQPFDPEPLGPPAIDFVPLRPVVLPEPDWRQEALERARRDEQALEEELPTIHPPPRRETP